MQGLAESLAVYFERRMARILLLGIISGFPWVLIGTSLTLWLAEDGLSRSTIGWAGLIFGVYAFNFLWAPLIDRVRLPWLSQRIGQRRGWILVLQAAVLMCLVLWSALDPSENLGSVVAVGLAIAVASATQDIAIDALRIEQMGKSESEAMAAGAAVAVVGWWSGFKLGGIVALETADGFQSAGIENYWQATFLVLGIVVVLCNIGLLFVREAAATDRLAAQAEDEERIAARLQMSGPLGRAAAWLGGTVVGPLMRFFAKNGVAIALAVLGFVFLFKIGEAFMGRMSLVFYTEIGFTKSDIALYSKGLGWIVTVGFTVLGGLVAIRIGLDPRHVRLRDRHGAHQSHVRAAGLVREVGGAVCCGRRHGRPHQRVRDGHLRRLHLDAGGPDLYRHPVRAAGLARHRGQDAPRRLLRRAGGLAGGRLGNLLRDHDAHGDPVARVPLGDPREAPRPAGRRAGAADGKGRGRCLRLAVLPGAVARSLGSCDRLARCTPSRSPSSPCR